MDAGTTAWRVRRRKAEENIYIRIPPRHLRESNAEDDALHQRLAVQLASVTQRFDDLQSRISTNEEELRKRGEKLNLLLMEIEKQELEEWSMGQQVKVIERCYHLMNIAVPLPTFNV